MERYRPMKCGSCGYEFVKLEALGSEPQIKSIRITCENCANRTLMMLSSPTIRLIPDGRNLDGGYHCIWDFEDDG